ncbi:MAG: Tex-like N-terminal domain-containing protein, partial [Planctomycetota bacterium]
MDKVIPYIANELALPLSAVSNTIKLLEEGNTIPFITRYRKEVTGGLDEDKIRAIEESLKYQKNLNLRKEEVLTSIREQGKLTPELEQQVQECLILARLEDLYLPYKKKKKTRAMIAKEKGYEPLAQALLQDLPLKGLSELYLTEAEEEAIAFARDILAEQFVEQIEIRDFARNFYWEQGTIQSEKTDLEGEQVQT